MVTARCGSLRSQRLYIVRLSRPLTGLGVLSGPRVIANPLGRPKRVFSSSNACLGPILDCEVFEAGEISNVGCYDN